MKADPSAQVRLLDLQELDARADQLRHQRRTLAEHARLAELTQARARIAGQAQDARISVDDLTAEQNKVESDVEQVRARRQRDQQRIEQGLVSNPKDIQRMSGRVWPGSTWAALGPLTAMPLDLSPPRICGTV